MIRVIAFPFALAGLAWAPLAAAPQPTPAEAAEASRAAEAVASRAQDAIERVDPTTLGPSQVLNPSLSDPYAAATIAPAPAGAAPVLPTISPLDEEVTYASAPRGPAVRMIAQEVAQPFPQAAPPAAAPAPLPVVERAAPRPPAPVAKAAQGKEPFVVKSILPIEGTIRYGDWFWDESAAPATGTLVITIDLEARVISAFRDGHEIGTAVALLGTPSHPTPTGTFPVLNKSREHFSRKYNNAPMPFSLWLTNTGIAIHGSPVTNGYASHGCIGVPDPFAEKLFAATKRGDKVIITRGRMIGIGDKVI
ncbi:MAG: L,D-transpeptidase family protein [Erythrobacter sp.]